MEAFNFELRLVSDVDKVAKRDADALTKLEGKGKKAQQELDFSKSVSRAEAALHRLEKDPAGFVKMKKAQRELAEQQKKLTNAAGLHKESFAEALGSKVSFGKMFGAAALADVLVEGGMKLGEGLIEAARSVVDIISEGVHKAFEESGREEKRRRQFKLSLGEEGGKESLEDAERFSKMTKFTPEQIAPTLLRLRRAGYSQKSARQTIATGSDIEAGGGLSMQEYAEFAEHLKLKGGVTTKQLVGAGINAPQFYKDLGKKLGISAAAAEKRAGEGGKIDPQLMLNQLTEAVNKKQGGAAGTGGLDESKGMEARFAKLTDLPNQYLKRLVDSPSYARVSEMLGNLLAQLDPDSESGKRIMGSLNRMFDSIAGKLGSLDVDKIAGGFEDAMSAAEGFLPVLTGLAETAAELARYVLDAASAFKVLHGSAAERAEGARELIQRKTEDAYRQQERDAKKAGLGEGRGVLAPETTPAPLVLDNRSAVRAAPGGKVININVHAGAAVVHAAAGEDPDHSHQAAAEGMAKHVVRELEKAAQEGGG